MRNCEKYQNGEKINVFSQREVHFFQMVPQASDHGFKFD